MKRIWELMACVGIGALIFVWGWGFMQSTPLNAVKISAYVTLLDSGTTFTMADTTQPSGNQFDSLIGPTVRVPLCDRYLITYGLSYTNPSCSLGIINDSGAVPIYFQTRQNATFDWLTVWLDTLHQVNESTRDTLLINAFTAVVDTFFGEQWRVIAAYEMDSDSVSNPQENDTVIVDRVHVIGYDLCGD